MEFSRRGGGGDRGPRVRVAGGYAHARAGPRTTRRPSHDSMRADEQLLRTRAPGRAPSRVKSDGSDRARALSLGSLASDWANAIANASAGASSAARRATGGALGPPCRRVHGAAHAIGSDCDVSVSGSDCAVPLCARLFDRPASATYKETEGTLANALRATTSEILVSSDERRTINRAPVPPFAQRAPT